MRNALLNGAGLRHLPMQTREAVVQPDTADDAARTVELVWSTGAKVRRREWIGWDGPVVEYDEALSLEPAHVDLSRLQNGAPLLNSHWTYDLNSQLGVVEKAWLKDGEGRALVRFSGREDVAPIWADVKARIIRNVSVGYNVRKFEVDKKQTPELRTAIDWQPVELSLVTIPADPGAGVRAARRGEPPLGPTYPCVLVERAHADGVPLEVLQRQLDLLRA